MSITNTEIQSQIDQIKNQATSLYETYIETSDRDAYDNESLRVTSEFISWLDSNFSPDYEFEGKEETYQFANGEISTSQLIVKSRDISGFQDELLREMSLGMSDNPTNQTEIMLGGFFNSDLAAVEITQLIQENTSKDIKSDLTEEYAWLFDYIRNVATPEANNELVTWLKDSLDALSPSNKASRSAVISKSLISIKKAIADNQESFSLHNPFKAGKSFKKATGGLPDVVSVYSPNDDLDDDKGENLLNFTAANSLTDLSMESDQLERHSAMLALAIFKNNNKINSKIGEQINKIVNKSVTSGNNTAQRLLVEAIYLGDDYDESNLEINNLLKVLGINRDDLSEIKNILNARVRITFFQTHTAKHQSKNIVEGVLDNISESQTNKERDESRKELNREINQCNSFLLANSQTIMNRDLNNNHPDLIEYTTTNQNNKSTPLSGAKSVSTHSSMFDAFVFSKIDSGMLMGDYLKSIASPSVGEVDDEQLYWKEYYDANDNQFQNPKDMNSFFKPASIYKRKQLTEDQLNILDEAEEKKGEFLKYTASQNQDNWAGDIKKPSSQSNATKIHSYYKSVKTSKVGVIQDYDQSILKEATAVDLSVVSMLSSSDIMRNSLLHNVFDVIQREFEKLDETQIKSKINLFNQLESVSKYADSVLNNKGQSVKNLSNQSVLQLRDQLEDATKLADSKQIQEQQSSKLDKVEEDYLLLYEYYSQNPETPLPPPHLNSQGGYQMWLKKYLESQKPHKAQEILQALKTIYKDGTQKGGLLSGFKSRYDELLVQEIDNETEIINAIAEYVVSMEFAKDMEEKTVEGILGNQPLADIFTKEDVDQIIAHHKKQKSSPSKKPFVLRPPTK